MSKIKFLLLQSLLFVNSGIVTAQTYVNPVLRGVADAGVIRYGGKYYMGGVATMGDFFISSDLTHWDERKHVYDFDTDYNKGTGAGNNQVHSDDIIYSGGLFHLLFSANYWGKDRHIVHIVHATSPHIEGPFTEVRDDQWMENRIDPQVFCDEDGRHYLYMVKFTDGNTIWARPMNPDFSFAGEAQQQFSSQPGTWETMDNRVAEGPFVIKYHGRYYMMYNANHTAAEYGNYRLGVCEADSPMGFNPGGKYPWPVVSPQTELLENTFTDLMRYGSKGYNAIDLNADTIRFTVDDELHPTDLRLKFAQRGGVSISLNGHTIEAPSDSPHWGRGGVYSLITIPADWIHTGVNEFTISKEKGRLVALALYDTSEQPCPFTDGPLLLTPGQPNIVRGPNGWQWWLSYMANEGFQRHQFIDRIHFVNDQLTVDGISGHNTPARPVPARPQYEGTSVDSIPEADSYLLEATARLSENAPAEVWRIEKNHTLLNVWKNHVKVVDNQPAPTNLRQLIQQAAQRYHIDYLSFNEGWDEFSPSGGGIGGGFSGWQGLTANQRGLVLTTGAWMKGSAANNYEFSVCFDNRTPDRGNYGVYAAYQDARNFVKITIDANNRQLISEYCRKGKTTRATHPLTYTDVHYPDIKYTDSFEKQYRFSSPTYVSEVWYPHLDADNDTYARELSLKEAAQRAYNDDMAAQMTLEYLDSDDNDRWKSISYNNAESNHRAWQRVTFPAVKTTALRLINRDPRLNNRLVYQLKTTRDFEASQQLRIERRAKTIQVFVGTRLFDTITLTSDAPTRIGLHADGQADVSVRNNLYYPIF